MESKEQVQEQNENNDTQQIVDKLKNNQNENNLQDEKQKPEYKEKDFWNQRYNKNSGFYDWYLSYKELKDIFDNRLNVSKDCSFLNVGCGNSKAMFEMVKDGYYNTTNVDYSEVVIEQMKQQSEERGFSGNIKFEVQDCTDMTYKDGEFDIVFDKGTFDALICGGELEPMLYEMQRVVKDQGQIIIITYGSPEERKLYFEEYFGFDKWEFSVSRRNLSTMAQMVNIMRSRTNLPLAEVMKDKVKLLMLMMEYQTIQSKLPPEQKDFEKVEWENIQFKQPHEKNQELIDEQIEEEKKEKQKQQWKKLSELQEQKLNQQEENLENQQEENLENQQKVEQEKQIQQDNQEEKQDQLSLQQNIQEEEEKQEDNQDKEKNNSENLEQNQKEGTKHRRQHYCYVYSIKKIIEN